MYNEDKVEFQAMQDEINELLIEMVQEYGPAAVAALLMINSLTLYNSFLDKDSYKSLMKTMYKEAIKFCEPQSRLLH
jgi:hypothetical protein